MRTYTQIRAELRRITIERLYYITPYRRHERIQVVIRVAAARHRTDQQKRKESSLYNFKPSLIHNSNVVQRYDINR